MKALKYILVALALIYLVIEFFTPFGYKV